MMSGHSNSKINYGTPVRGRGANTSLPIIKFLSARDRDRFGVMRWDQSIAVLPGSEVVLVAIAPLVLYQRPVAVYFYFAGGLLRAALHGLACRSFGGPTRLLFGDE